MVVNKKTSSFSSSNNQNHRRRRRPVIQTYMSDSIKKPESRVDSFKSTAPTQQIKKVGSVSRRGNTKNKTHSNSSKRKTNTRTVQKRNGEQVNKKREIPIHPAGDNIRIIPLGGVEEIGKNMYIMEYQDDIIVMDCGFAFKSEETPGVDYILPNTEYLEKRKEKIKGVIITHGHLDHIGGLPYVMHRIGNPPVYSRNLTTIMIQKKYEEFKDLEPLDLRVVENDSRISLGKLKVKFFGVTHTIPDSMGVIIETPFGSIVNPGDFKLSHVDGKPIDEEEDAYKVFDTEKVLFLMSDSTNVENPGFSTPEHVVKEGLDKVIKETKTRLIIGTFASQMERMIGIINSIEKYNKKLAVEGRSMKINIEIAKLAGILSMKPDTLIPSEDIEKYPPDRVVVLATGAQGEEFAALMRMASKNHKYIKMSERDTVLLSSSVIPGNENSVQKLKDNIARNGAKIIHYRTSEIFIHGSGHGNREEIKWLHKKIKPKFFMPIHGTHYMLRMHAQLAEELGMPKENIVVPDNGTIVEIQDGGNKLVRLDLQAPSDIVAVDGFSIGNMQDVVIRDRQLLSEDGIFIIVVALNTRTGKLRKSPDIISRGFVYLRESQNLLQESRVLIKKTVEDATRSMNPVNFDIIKAEITDQVRKFLLQKTDKKPVVIPVILGI
ncbi:ribonuclease J [Candidatus Campbellbacteria bacterium CG22_combo_CG10-13_8_21_14_all_36_13]|uniref:Ribonuclease J n=1 Tax=Candidatus Campbellbacteria bacterium CG22_combo_CG10-13_8_21_14_all_36_13 TaxID=1974529 RepID=A0A2H0DY31_9BACT|nr:MAG: ribonuclease J [Candidatus Campbellbacteria bacterium CG22_combo_CG10-13_8_21_14_all_36_13]